MNNADIGSIAGSGAQAAGQAFVQIMQALASERAMQMKMQQANLNSESSKSINEGQMTTAKNNASTARESDYLQNLLRVGAQGHSLRNNQSTNRQASTDSLTSGILSALKGR